MIALYKVLIADDQDILRFDLKRMPVWGDDSGFLIAGEANNGLEAIRMLREAPYDLLITDIRMPVVDGIELLKTVAEEELCPCVVLLSDYTEFSYAREGLLHGAFDYIGKPVASEQIKDLLGRVRMHLEKRKQELEKLKTWENLVDEAFFPSAHVEKAVSLLNQGSTEALDAVSQLIDSVGAAMHHDLSKSSIIIKNAIDAVLDRVMAENEWIGLYWDVAELKKLELDDAAHWSSMEDKVLGLFREFLEFLHRFILWGKTNAIVRSACLHVLFNVEDDISVKNVAEKLFISKAHLSEVFKQSTGISLLEYITAVKVERAKYLLKASTLKNYEIAEKLGFSDHEYFTRVFKKHTGFTPAIFRKQIP